MKCNGIQNGFECTYRGKIIISHEKSRIWKLNTHPSWKWLKESNVVAIIQKLTIRRGSLEEKLKLGWWNRGFFI